MYRSTDTGPRFPRERIFGFWSMRIPAGAIFAFASVVPLSSTAAPLSFANQISRQAQHAMKFSHIGLLLSLFAVAEVSSFLSTIPSVSLPIGTRSRPYTKLRSTSNQHCSRSTSSQASRMEAICTEQPVLRSRDKDANASPESTSHHWEWKKGWDVHYEKAGTDGAPILLLSGFGVGGFHYERNVAELAKTNRVWTMDIMGLGRSWPTQDPAPGGGFTEPGFEWGFGPAPNNEVNAQELSFSSSMWKQQIIDFLERVVDEPVYLAGNSLGGYLSTMVAAERPDLVKGIFLMNATPFWGFGMSKAEESYPLPSWVRPLTRACWDTLRHPATLQTVLSQAYVDSDRIGEKLVEDIVEETAHPAAVSALASMLSAPAHRQSFDDMLRAVSEQGLPVGLCYGKQDPWIGRFWGHRAQRSAPAAEYWEISQAGHCPHHEAPEAVNALLAGWLQRMESKAPAAPEGNVLSVARGSQWDATPGRTEAFTASLQGPGARSVLEMADDAWAEFCSSRAKSPPAAASAPALASSVLRSTLLGAREVHVGGHGHGHAHRHAHGH